jgi:putative photosynthetic complex assembly protein
MIPGIAGVILGGTLLCATAARLTGFAAPPAPPAPIASRSLSFADLSNGGVAVRDGASHALLADVPARSDGFLRMTLRLLAAARTRQNIGAAQPFLLTEFAGGRMQLCDPATGLVIELEAFGPSNIAEFATFFSKGAHA